MPAGRTQEGNGGDRATRRVGDDAYGRAFWLAYVANCLAVIGIALLYRYADFVTLLGGGELELGWIVGLGMVGSLAVRLSLGMWIDRHGPRRIWLASLVLFVVACLAHLAIRSCHGPAIYMLRFVYCSAVAGIFGASMTFISARGSPARIAEMVGMLGTSGFLGVVIGTQLGDLFLGTSQLAAWQVGAMFFSAAVLGAAAAVFAYLATVGQARPEPHPAPPVVSILRRHLPVSAVVGGIAMGMGLGLPSVFLRPYAAELGIARIGLFFTVYAPAAIVTRLVTRRWSERFGPQPMILVGLGGVALSLLALLAVEAEWQLVLPGVGFGIAHAILFPAVVAAGTERFPIAHRGLATTFIMGMWDAGQLVGSPLAGAILYHSPAAGLPAYPTMFLIMAGLMALAAAYQARVCRRLGLLGHKGDQRPGARSEAAASPTRTTSGSPSGQVGADVPPGGGELLRVDGPRPIPTGAAASPEAPGGSLDRFSGECYNTGVDNTPPNKSSHDVSLPTNVSLGAELGAASRHRSGRPVG